MRTLDVTNKEALEAFKLFQISTRMTFKEILSLVYSLAVIKKLLKDINHQDKDLSLVGISHLRELFLHSSQIKEIPKELGNLINIRYLSLSRNQIKEIPKELGNLINLKKLYISNNQITEIPKELGNLTNLQILSLSNNPIIEIPAEILQLKEKGLIILL